MDNADLQVLRQVETWHHAGEHVVLGTVTRTWGSAPRPIGSLVAITASGRIAGSVSGGCIEDDLVDRVRSGEFGLRPYEEGPRVVRYGIQGDEAARFGLPCGGTVELVLEPVSDATGVPSLLSELVAGRCVRRTVRLSDGSATLESMDSRNDSDQLRLDAETLMTSHGPRWRMLVIGASQMTKYLAEMAAALNYQVTVCDPRDEYTEEFEISDVALVRSMPDDAVIEFQPDAHSAIIALTHDPKLDDLALLEALRSSAFYVGAIGSGANQAKRRARLAEHFDVLPAELERLHGPVGLKNGARTPAEIAVAILAELTASRYGLQFAEPTPLRSPPSPTMIEASIDTSVALPG